MNITLESVPTIQMSYETKSGQLLTGQTYSPTYPFFFFLIMPSGHSYDAQLRDHF